MKVYQIIKMEIKQTINICIIEETLCPDILKWFKLWEVYGDWGSKNFMKSIWCFLPSHHDMSVSIGNNGSNMVTGQKENTHLSTWLKKVSATSESSVTMHSVWALQKHQIKQQEPSESTIHLNTCKPFIFVYTCFPNFEATMINFLAQLHHAYSIITKID